MTAVVEENIIDPIPSTYTLESGLEVDVLDLRTVQTLSLFRILTHGAPGFLENGFADLFEGDTEEIIGRLIGLIVFSIPEAPEQSIEFLSTMIRPSDLEKARPSDKAARLRNEERWEALSDEMENPALEDLIGLIELIVVREAPHFESLGKRLMGMLDRLNPTTPNEKNSAVPAKSASRKTSAKSTQKDTSEV